MATRVKNIPRTLPHTYFQLVKQLPLARLRNDQDLHAAKEMIDRLLQRNLDRGAQEYLDVLTDLVEAYEDEHHPIPDAFEADVLRELMRSKTTFTSTLVERDFKRSAMLTATSSRSKMQTCMLMERCASATRRSKAE